MKKIVVLACCFAMLMSASLPMRTYASTTEAQQVANEDSMLRWTNTASIFVHLSINNGRALMAGTVVGNAGTESITVNAVLERENPNGSFTHIGSWNNLRTNGNTWAWERPHMVARGHNYRLTLTATVVRNGVSEVVSLSRTTWAN